MSDVTVILRAIETGSASSEQLLPLVYDELRRLAGAKMQQERPGHTLQATALVHESFLRLVGDAESSWDNRRHFFSAAATAMERILVENARRRQSLKRGGDWQREPLDDVAIECQHSDTDLLLLTAALVELTENDPQKAELVRLRYFAGLSEQEAAETLQISRATAARWWAFAKAWLFEKMNG